MELDDGEMMSQNYSKLQQNKTYMKLPSLLQDSAGLPIEHVLLLLLLLMLLLLMLLLLLLMLMLLCPAPHTDCYCLLSGRVAARPANRAPLSVVGWCPTPPSLPLSLQAPARHQH